MKLSAYLNYLTEFIRETVALAHAEGVIIGVSGGVDSAVVARLGQHAFPNNHLMVWMPLDSSLTDERCVKKLITTSHGKNVTVDLKNSHQELMKTCQKAKVELTPLAVANTKARLRMTTLYALGQSLNYLVLGTDNYDEWYLGYFTKYGDGGVDVAPLVHLLKGEVYEAAKLLQVPKEIITRAPTAGLWDGQTDEKEIGFSYQEIDDFFTKKKQNPELKTRINQLHQQSEHKRNLPVQPKPWKR